MSSKTKIVVLHMKELIYTGIFMALGILFIVLLVIMFLPGKDSKEQSSNAPRATEPSGNADQEPEDDRDAPVSSDGIYIPGIYTTQLVLNDQTVDVEVIVDSESITSLRLINLNESITTMYPLLEPTFDSLCEQIYEKQSVNNITYETENKYTSLVLLEAIKNSLEKARNSITESDSADSSGKTE